MDTLTVVIEIDSNRVAKIELIQGRPGEPKAEFPTAVETNHKIEVFESAEHLYMHWLG